MKNKKNIEQKSESYFQKFINAFTSALKSIFNFFTPKKNKQKITEPLLTSDINTPISNMTYSQAEAFFNKTKEDVETQERNKGKQEKQQKILNKIEVKNIEEVIVRGGGDGQYTTPPSNLHFSNMTYSQAEAFFNKTKEDVETQERNKGKQEKQQEIPNKIEIKFVEERRVTQVSHQKSTNNSSIYSEILDSSKQSAIKSRHSNESDVMSYSQADALYKILNKMHHSNPGTPHNKTLSNRNSNTKGSQYQSLV